MSVVGQVSKPALRANWVSQRERSATRDALIHVARELVARDGEPALTLGAVADEAGLARATVYGFFAGRGELLDALDKPETSTEPARAEAAISQPDDGDDTAIWANCPPDLSEFLAAPEEETAADIAQPQPAAGRDTSEDWVVYEAAAVAPEAPAEPAEEAVAEPARPVEARAETVEQDEVPALEEPVPAAGTAALEPEAAVEPQAAPEESGEAADEVHAQTAPAEEDEPESTGDERRRLQAAHLEEIAKRLILPESALKEGTDAVISRLDTRIRVLEKSISGLETRHLATEAEHGKRLKPVTDAVEQLRARADGADAKGLQTVSELRLSIHHLETRMDALEAPHRGAVSGALSWPEPAETHQTPEPDAASADAVEPAGEDGGADSDNPKREHYLSAVRTLAKEGARQAAERETAYETERQARRKQMIAAACIAVVCLGAIGILFEFHPGAHGVSAANSKAYAASVLADPARHAAQSRAPLDRLTALAQKGDANAELLVGLKYLEHNDTLAARWLDRSAGHGNAVAQNALGALYQNGRFVKADLATAARLYETAAMQGNRHAMSNLAVLYAGADEKAKDFAEAARWFQRSAGLGYVDAQFNLAVLYERGDGVPQSLLEAYKWYTIASASADAVAKTRADAIATQISPEELAAARRAVAEFKPQPLNTEANDVPALQVVLAAR